MVSPCGDPVDGARSRRSTRWQSRLQSRTPRPRREAGQRSRADRGPRARFPGVSGLERGRSMSGVESSSRRSSRTSPRPRRRCTSTSSGSGRARSASEFADACWPRRRRALRSGSWSTGRAHAPTGRGASSTSGYCRPASRCGSCADPARRAPHRLARPAPRRWNLDGLGHVDHRKCFIVDGRIGWVGGGGHRGPLRRRPLPRPVPARHRAGRLAASAGLPRELSLARRNDPARPAGHAVPRTRAGAGTVPPPCCTTRLAATGRSQPPSPTLLDGAGETLESSIPTSPTVG